MKKAVLFDLYGTLIDIRTDEDDPWVYQMLSRFLSYHSVRVKPEELKDAFNTGVKEYMRKSAEACPEVDVYMVFKEIMRRYGDGEYPECSISDVSVLFRSLTIRSFGLFPRVKESLESISSKCRVALVSDAQWVFTEPEIATAGLDRFFEHRVLSSRFGFKKPDRRLFDIALGKIGTKAEDALYVGDNPYRDLPGAKNAGLDFILFRNERREYNGLKPDACFYDYSELEDLINREF